MTKSKTETKKKMIIFEKLTVEEEKKVKGSSAPATQNCQAGPPSLLDC